LRWLDAPVSGRRARDEEDGDESVDSHAGSVPPPRRFRRARVGEAPITGARLDVRAPTLAGMARAALRAMTRASRAMTRASCCCLVAIAIGCGGGVDPPAFPVPDELGSRHVVRAGSGHAAADPPPISDPAKVRFHMRRHLDDLRAVERLLIGGKLAEARSLAFLLSRPVRDAGLDAWSAAAARASAAALALSEAMSLDEACRLAPRVAEACGDCHRRAGTPPAIGRVPPPPPDDPTPRARMARHQWAADRLWEGLVWTSARSWCAGLEVLAAAPLPSLPDAAGARLQRVARAALDAVPRDTPADRARAYGELLVTCAGCHASHEAPGSPPGAGVTAALE
jgi:hypothetical protein